MPQAEKSQRAKFEGVSTDPRDGTQRKLSRHVRGFCSRRNNGNTGQAPALLVVLQQCTREHPSGGDTIVATLTRNGGIGIAATRAQNSAVAPNETPGTLQQLLRYLKL